MPKPRPLKTLRIPFRHIGLMCKLLVPAEGVEPSCLRPRRLRTLRIPFRHAGIGRRGGLRSHYLRVIGSALYQLSYATVVTFCPGLLGRNPHRTDLCHSVHTREVRTALTAPDGTGH